MKPWQIIDESLPIGRRFTKEAVKRLRESYKFLVDIGDRPPFEYGLALDEIDVLREERDQLRAALENVSWRLSQVIRLRDKSDPWSRVELIRDDAREAATLAGEGEAKRCAWTYDETHCAWDSSCGEKWILEDGGPNENRIRFCHGCSKPVEVACEATPEKARQA